MGEREGFGVGGVANRHGWMHDAVLFGVGGFRFVSRLGRGLRGSRGGGCDQRDGQCPCWACWQAC